MRAIDTMARALSCLLAAACLLLAATLPGHLMDGRTLPPGIVTPLVGVPVVMVLLLSQRQRMQ